MFVHSRARPRKKKPPNIEGLEAACNNVDGKRFPVADFASPSAIRVLAIGDPGFRVLPGPSVLVMLLVLLLACGGLRHVVK